MVTRRFIFSILSGISFLFPSALISQSGSDSISANLELTLGGRRQAGAFSQTLVTATGTGSVQSSGWSLENNTSYTYSIANEILISNDWSVVSTLRYSPNTWKKVSPTLLHIYKNNLIYRIQHSQRALLGLHLTPLTSKPEFWLFVGGGLEHTRYNGEEFNRSPLINSVRNFPLAILFLENSHVLMKDRVTFSYQLFYLQSLEEAPDWTVWLIPDLQLHVTSAVALSVTYDYRFRNVHLTEIPGFNSQLSFSIRVQLES